MRGKRGLSEGFSFDDSYGLFSQNPSRSASIGIDRSDSIIPFAGHIRIGPQWSLAAGLLVLISHHVETKFRFMAFLHHV